jgi:hypothetical protein
MGFETIKKMAWGFFWFGIVPIIVVLALFGFLVIIQMFNPACCACGV